MNNDQRIYVLQFITELSTGGAQTVLLNLLSGIDRSQFKVTVVCLYNGDGAVAEQIKKRGFTVIDLHMQHKWQLDALWRLLLVCRRENPAILHTWMFHPNVLGRVIGRLAGVKRILNSEHTMGQESRMRLRLNRLTSVWADKIICVSESIAEFARTRICLPSDKLVIIPNGVELEQFAHLPNASASRHRFDLPMEQFIIGAVGRPRPVKGYVYLIDAFAELAKGNQLLHLLFVGDGPDRPSLEAKVTALGLADRVTFLGDQVDIPGVLAGVDLLVSSSLWEGLPMVVLEAMAAGVPVVATNVGGTPELVIHEETGLLVEPQDVAGLAKAIQRLHTDATFRQRLAIAGQSFVCEQYSVVENVKRTQQLYRDIMAMDSQPQ